MSKEDWFGLALRVIGFAVLLYGIGYLLDSSLLRLGYWNYPEANPLYYVIVGVSYCVVGLYLLRGAPQIVGFAYPSEEEEEQDKDSDDLESNQHV